MPLILQLRAVTKRFGAFVAVDALDLDVQPGEFLTLLGASGSGKTTTLRMIAGFEHPTSGEILMDGQPLTGLPPFKRDLNTVFQQYALFPHMSVRDNVGYGLRMRGVRSEELTSRVTAALELVQLGHLEQRAPRQLSGGQQQRVALARALVNRPRVLLLDEPLGALDLKLRKEMQLELRHLNRQLGITFIYVTHDQEEALTMSDRIALMRNGTIAQLDPPATMYARPGSRYVADFLGDNNLLKATSVRRVGDGMVEMIIGRVNVRATAAAAWREAGESWLAVRPEYCRPVLPGEVPSHRLEVTARDVVFAGSLTRLHAMLADGQGLMLHWPAGEAPPSEGAQFGVTWPVEHGVCLGE
ncbi:MAG: ABC transporter ATP-binding protein [Gemmatimonadales bacterium]